jgi:predicted Fe-Mo cluster-binding NifX family protein
MDFKNAVIAIVTDDGTTVSSHFGRAQFYEVITFTDGKAVKQERREKAAHHSFASQAGPDDDGHHHGESHQRRHQTMVSPVMDCMAVIARGMGQGAVDHLRQSNLLPILTGLHTIDEVINAVAAGSLENDARRIHQHHPEQQRSI